MGGKARKKRHGCCCGCLTAALVIVVCSAIIPSISAMRSNHTIEKLNALSMEMPDGGEAEFVTEGDKVELRMPKEFGKMYYTKSDAEHYTTAGNGEAFVDNEILVVANKGVSAETIAETAERIRAEIVGEITITGDYQLRLQEPRSYDELNALCQELCEDPAIADAYPDWLNPDESDDVSAYRMMFLRIRAAQAISFTAAARRIQPQTVLMITIILFTI